MKMSQQWVPIDQLSFREIPTIKEFIELNLGLGGDLYIFRTPSDLKKYGDHYGRLKFSDELSKKSFSKLRKKKYDLVFLYVRDNPLMYDIIKLEQKKDESIICQITGNKGLGPVFKDSLQSPFNHNTKYIVEEFLAQADGWNPIYLLQKTIKRHYNKFLGSFGELMSDIHNNGIVYNDTFWKHIFYNPLNNKCQLVDFGNSYESSNPTDIYDEVLRINNFLYTFFPEKKTEVKSIFDKNYNID